MAQSAKESADMVLEALSEFYVVIGEDSVEDLKDEWKRRQKAGAPTLYQKIAISIEGEEKKKRLKISEKRNSFKPPKWEVELTRSESIELAHQILRSWGVMV